MPMTNSSSLSIVLDGVEPVPDAAETTGGVWSATILLLSGVSLHPSLRRFFI